MEHRYLKFENKSLSKHYYLIKMDSKKLYDYCYISRRSENKTDGFQRLLSKKKARDISQYYLDGGLIPSPIVLSMRKNIDIKINGDVLSFDEQNDIFLVIDGQHRLYGLSYLDESIEIPVAIFEGLTLEEEVNLFIDINTNQKGVTSALLLDIKDLSGNEGELENIQRKIFDKLSTSDSVVSDLLSPDEAKRGMISRPAFNESTEDIFKKSILKTQNFDILYTSLYNYIEAFNKMYTESNSIANIGKTIFFKVALKLFDDVTRITISDWDKLDVDSIYNTISILENIDFNYYSGTNKQTENKLFNEMKEILYSKSIHKINAERLF